MPRIFYLAAVCLVFPPGDSAAAQSGGDSLTRALAIINRAGPTVPDSLRVAILPAARIELPQQPAIAGRWLAGGTTEWVFGGDGTFQISGTRNKGQWKTTGSGIAVKYSGATVWINLKFVGESLVDQDGFIGRAQLRKIGN